jgi:maleate isomerase
MNVQAGTAADAAPETAVEGAVVAAGVPASTRVIENIPFDTDAGIGARARMGLLVLASDHTIEHEFRAVLAHLPGVALYESRLFNDAAITPATLAAMEGRIVPAAELILPDEALDVVAFGCTSAAMVLGEERVFELIREAKPGTKATTPITAAFAALHAFGARRIGVLTPYGAQVNAAVQRYIEAAGFEIPVFGSFNEENDPTVSAITPDSVRRAARQVAGAAEIDALFVACTSLRLVEAAGEIEAELGLPVTSSNHATIWHCLRLAGIDDAVPGFGRLFGLPLG